MYIWKTNIAAAEYTYIIHLKTDYNIIMALIKSKTLFTKIPTIFHKDTTDNNENNKISDWLEKLHIQGEKIRIDNNRREEKQLKTHASEKLEKEKISKEKARDQTQSGIDAHTRTAAEKNEADKQMVNDLVKKS